MQTTPFGIRNKFTFILAVFGSLIFSLNKSERKRGKKIADIFMRRLVLISDSSSQWGEIVRIKMRNQMDRKSKVLFDDAINFKEVFQTIEMKL